MIGGGGGGEESDGVQVDNAEHSRYGRRGAAVAASTATPVQAASPRTRACVRPHVGRPHPSDRARTTSSGTHRAYAYYTPARRVPADCSRHCDDMTIMTIIMPYGTRVTFLFFVPFRIASSFYNIGAIRTVGARVFGYP